MSEETIISKQCVKCLESYSLNTDNFRINKKTKTGFKNECKKCDSIRAQEYYLKHKKKLIKGILRKRKELKKLSKLEQNPVISSNDNIEISQENITNETISNK